MQLVNVFLRFEKTWIWISTIYGWTQWKILETTGLMPKKMSGWDSLKLFQLFDKRLQCQFLSSLANIGVFFFIRRKKMKTVLHSWTTELSTSKQQKPSYIQSCWKANRLLTSSNSPRKGETEGNSFRGHIVAIVSKAAFQITVGGFCCI